MMKINDSGKQKTEGGQLYSSFLSFTTKYVPNIKVVCSDVDFKIILNYSNTNH